MGIRRWLSGTLRADRLETDEVDAESVKAVSLVDSIDDQAWETLRELGYESGDFLPVCTVPLLGGTASVSSTSYTNIGSINTASQTSLGTYPSATTGIRINVSVTNDTSGESTFVRAISAFTSVPDSEVTHTGTGFTQVTGPAAVDPPESGGGGTRVSLEAKVSGGVGKVEGNATAEVGVILP